MIQQGKGAAVERAVGKNVLSRTGNGPEAGRDGAHAGTGGDTGLAAFQGGNLGLKDGYGRVAQPRVDIAVFLAGKPAAALFAAVKNKGGCLVDGGRERAVLCILDIAGMDGFGTETAGIFFHCY